MERLTFTEFDAFAEAVQDASTAMRMCSLEEPLWTLQYAAVGPVRVQRGFEGGGSIAEGATPGDGWVLYHQSLPLLTNGQAATGDDVFACAPGAEFCLACDARHEWSTVYVPTSALFPSSRDLEFASRAGPQLLRAPPHVTRRFASLVHRFLSAVEAEPRLSSSSLALDSYRMALLEAVKDLFRTSQHSASRHFDRWRDDARSSVELAMRCSDDSLSMPELARRVGVPERTLRTAFQKYYGLSPLKFLRLHRLHQARRLLRAGCPDGTTVTEIAFGLGFWDLGRFAGAYRRLFRERPSETLRRSAMDRRVS